MNRNNQKYRKSILDTLSIHDNDKINSICDFYIYDESSNYAQNRQIIYDYLKKQVDISIIPQQLQ